MTQAAFKQTRAAFDCVRAILHGEWDPIGAGVPLDEYDSYCWPVLAKLQRGAPRAEVEAYLCWAADTQMRSPVPAQRLACVLDKLMAINLS